MSDFQCALTVPHLLSGSRPSTVFRFIVGVIVDPIKRCAVWSWSHVAIEGREIIPPFFAHRYSTRSVVTVFLIRWIKAASLGGTPRRIFFRIRQSVGNGVLPNSFKAFVAATATAFRLALLEITSIDNRRVSATADAGPYGKTGPLSGEFNYSQTAELSVSQVFNFAKNVFSHDALRGVVVRAAAGGCTPQRLAYFTT